jgi:S1-C subfamily serine protease
MGQRQPLHLPLVPQLAVDQLEGDLVALVLRGHGLKVRAPVAAQKLVRMFAHVASDGEPRATGSHHAIAGCVFARTRPPGIVSGTERSIPGGGSSLAGLIQTDAPISPGNSGGVTASR